MVLFEMSTEKVMTALPTEIGLGYLEGKVAESLAQCLKRDLLNLAQLSNGDQECDNSFSIFGRQRLGGTRI